MTLHSARRCRPWSLLGLLFLLSLAGPALGYQVSPRTQPQPGQVIPGKQGKIFFSWKGRIWKMEPDGTMQESVSHTWPNFNHYFPHVTPTGSRLIFVTGERGPGAVANPVGGFDIDGREIVWMRPTGASAQILYPKVGQVSWPEKEIYGWARWSQDLVVAQMRILFCLGVWKPDDVEYDPEIHNSYIYVMENDGTNPRVLISPNRQGFWKPTTVPPHAGEGEPLFCAYPIYKTRERTIFTKWLRDDPNDNWSYTDAQLYTTLVQEGQPVEPCSGGARDTLTQQPALSPDGLQLAFYREADVYKCGVSADGKLTGTPVPVTTDAGENNHPSWSLDGKKIVYHKYDPPPGIPAGIWVIDADGKNDVCILPDRLAFHPFWAQDWSGSGDGPQKNLTRGDTIASAGRDAEQSEPGRASPPARTPPSDPRQTNPPPDRTGSQRTPPPDIRQTNPPPNRPPTNPRPSL